MRRPCLRRLLRRRSSSLLGAASGLPRPARRGRGRARRPPASRLRLLPRWRCAAAAPAAISSDSAKTRRKLIHSLRKSWGKAASAAAKTRPGERTDNPELSPRAGRRSNRASPQQAKLIFQYFFFFFFLCENRVLPVQSPFRRLSTRLDEESVPRGDLPAQCAPTRSAAGRRGAEIAFAGRSNAGKSSALNKICDQQGLARTSKTPGRTQQLVVFPLDETHRLIDLPGYGYAKVPEKLREHWRMTIDAYLRTRESLKGIVLVMDARHPLQGVRSHDARLRARDRAYSLCLLTKADKLSRGDARARCTRCRRSSRRSLPVRRRSSSRRSRQRRRRGAQDAGGLAFCRGWSLCSVFGSAARDR